MNRFTIRLNQWFALQTGDLKQLFPFFNVYFLTFAMLSLVDGISLSLLVKQLGAHSLPQYYLVGACLNTLVNGLYLQLIPRATSKTLFQWIIGAALLVIVLACLGLSRWLPLPEHTVIGGLFAAREVIFTLILMHFGNTLQDYFDTSTLDRILPITYSGGRLGSLLGGVLLAGLSSLTGLLPLLWVAVAFGLITLLTLQTLPNPDPSCLSSETPNNPSAPSETASSLWHSRLFQAFTITTALFIISRWLLNYQYNDVFETTFQNALEMSTFVGWYTLIAMTLAIFIQTVVINRLTIWPGIGPAFLGYSVLMVLIQYGLLIHPHVFWATLGRFVENEFRMGYRNPLAILITNRFHPAWRKKARAISMGMVIPLATVITSSVLMAGVEQPSAMMTGLILASSIPYLMASYGLLTQLRPAMPSSEPK